MNEHLKQVHENRRRVAEWRSTPGKRIMLEDARKRSAEARRHRLRRLGLAGGY